MRRADERDCNTNGGRVASVAAAACAGSSRGRYKQERLACFFGGLPVADDGRAMKRRPACVVGTPGRMKQLVEMDILRTDQVRTVVLDEADQLLTKSGFCEDVLFDSRGEPQAEAIDRVFGDVFEEREEKNRKFDDERWDASAARK